MRARSERSSSRWVNPNGLPADEQYTSARDMAILARAALREFPEYDSYWHLPGIRMGILPLGIAMTSGFWLVMGVSVWAILHAVLPEPPGGKACLSASAGMTSALSGVGQNAEEATVIFGYPNGFPLPAGVYEGRLARVTAGETSHRAFVTLAVD